MNAHPSQPRRAVPLCNFPYELAKSSADCFHKINAVIHLYVFKSPPALPLESFSEEKSIILQPIPPPSTVIV